MPDTSSTKSSGTVPGEVGLWVFIFGDMSIFTLFFGVYAYYRGLEVDVFNASQQLLNVNLAAINTLVLLFSSWLVVLAIRAIREDRFRNAALLFAGALVCGVTFATIKIYEYVEKVADGMTLNTNYFFTFYYMLTGIHLLHVLVGIVVLAVMSRRVVKRSAAEKGESFFVGGACYWAHGRPAVDRPFSIVVSRQVGPQ